MADCQSGRSVCTQLVSSVGSFATTTMRSVSDGLGVAIAVSCVGIVVCCQVEEVGFASSFMVLYAISCSGGIDSCSTSAASFSQRMASTNFF